MIRISNIEAKLDTTLAELQKLVAAKLDYNGQFKSFKIAKKALDARSKGRLHWVYSLDVELDYEEKVLETCSYQYLDKIVPIPQFQLTTTKHPALRPVVVGSGPAGMLAGIALAEAGLCPIILERGCPVLERQMDVQAFWQGADLKPNSNVQFGEGGAGTFSDGKLMSGIKKDVYTSKVLKELVDAGAPEDIVYLAKPHIGTDNLSLIVQKIRAKIIALGGEYRFQNRLEDLIIKDGQLQGLRIVDAEEKIYEQSADKLILAVGHSARDTFEMLYKNGLSIIQKPFSVGARIEHSQNLIDKSQYGAEAKKVGLGAADYKLAYHGSNGRSAYTFCMCPGGKVIGAASETGRLVTNGMSEYARDQTNANSGLLVGVEPADFGGEHPLQGMYFQRDLEAKAFQIGGKNYHAPAQLVGDFLKNKPSKKHGEVKPSYQPGVTMTDLSLCLPDFITNTMRLAITDMDNRLRGFSSYEAILTGVETRSSSPIRIVRDTQLLSNIKGIYPCGEGAGYAGGIMSAAVDGLKCAEQLTLALS